MRPARRRPAFSRPILFALLCCGLLVPGLAEPRRAPVRVQSVAPDTTGNLRQGQTVLLRPGQWAVSYLRSDDGTRADLSTAVSQSGDEGRAVVDAPQVCAVTPRAWNGIPVPGESDLDPVAFTNPATVNRAGRIAFVGRLDARDRNQGVFVADADGVRAIAVGCGGGGGSGRGDGCGDPSPLGGTFSGFFEGTPFAPAINDRGDVLFLADVDHGDVPRGLFLYTASTGRITSVATAGEKLPPADKLEAVGPGSLNNSGVVAFLASRPGETGSDIYLWRDGALTRVVGAGDPAPGGGFFDAVGTEAFGFVDGTIVPVGPVPALDNAGRIAFRADAGGRRLFFLSSNGVHETVLATGDAAPGGGTFSDLWAPLLNNSGQFAFEGDVRLPGGGFTAAWFTGTPGSWRRTIGFGDLVDGGAVGSIAVSRNPLRALDDTGDLAVWCDLSTNGGRERLIAIPAASAPVMAAREGDPAPGGRIGAIQHWPAFSHSRITLGVAMPGGPGGIHDGQLLVELGPPSPVSWHPDADGDGHGAPSPAQTACVGPEGWVRSGDDCDDGNPAVHPGAPELCNGIDDDCDGTVDGRTCEPLAPLYPVDGAETEADASPLTFGWRGGDFTGYRLEWSSSEAFQGGRNASGDGWIATTSFAPTLPQWRSILRLGARSGTISWRVTGKSAAGGLRTGPANRLRLAPVRSAAIVSPGEAAAFASAGAPPTLVWDANHNARFAIAFSSDPAFGPRSTVTIGGGYRLTGAQHELTASEWKRVTLPPGPASAAGPRAIYCSVLSRDALGRTARSPARTLLITN